MGPLDGRVSWLLVPFVIACAASSSERSDTSGRERSATVSLQSCDGDSTGSYSISVKAAGAAPGFVVASGDLPRLGAHTLVAPPPGHNNEPYPTEVYEDPDLPGSLLLYLGDGGAFNGCGGGNCPPPKNPHPKRARLVFSALGSEEGAVFRFAFAIVLNTGTTLAGVASGTLHKEPPRCGTAL